MTNFARLMEEAAEKFRQLRSEFDVRYSRRAECEDFQTHMMNAAAEYRRLEREAVAWGAVLGYVRYAAFYDKANAENVVQNAIEVNGYKRAVIEPLFAVPVEGGKCDGDCEYARELRSMKSAQEE